MVGDTSNGIGALGDDTTGGHFTQHFVSVSFSSAVSDHWNPYVEAFWVSRQNPGGGPVVALDAGAIYELGARFALDGGVQVGLTHEPRAVKFSGHRSLATISSSTACLERPFLQKGPVDGRRDLRGRSRGPSADDSVERATSMRWWGSPSRSSSRHETDGS